MTSAAPLSPAALLDQQAGDAQRYRSLLHELMDVGMVLVRAVREQATAETGGEEPGAESVREAAVTFDLLSRAVRRTVALALRVTAPMPAPADPARESAPARRAERDADVSQWSDGDLDAAVARAELCERPDGPELDDETGGRPVAEVVADICRDLGLSTMPGNHPWQRRLPADVAALCERAARPPGGQHGESQLGAEPSPPSVPEKGGRFRTWSGPPAHNGEASIELMRKTMEHHRPRIRGP